MTAKDDFTEEFIRITDKHPNDFKNNPIAISAILNGYPKLKKIMGPSSIGGNNMKPKENKPRKQKVIKKNDSKNKKCSYCHIAKSSGRQICPRCNKRTGVTS